MIHVVPIPLDGPTFEVRTEDIDYIVWAPREHPPVRQHWSACWSTINDTDMHRGDTLDEVIQVFPDEIAEAFTAEIARYLAGDTEYMWDDPHSRTRIVSREPEL